MPDDFGAIIVGAGGVELAIARKFESSGQNGLASLTHDIRISRHAGRQMNGDARRDNHVAYKI